MLDLFQTDTADFADYVLPAASFLEFDDIVTSYFNLTISPQVKASEPMGEALPNQEIFRRLARAMGYDEPELYESDESMLDAMCRQAKLAGGFAALKASGTVNPFAAAGDAIRRRQIPDPQRQDRDRLGQGRSHGPAAHPAAPCR